MTSGDTEMTLHATQLPGRVVSGGKNYENSGKKKTEKKKVSPSKVLELVSIAGRTRLCHVSLSSFMKKDWNQRVLCKKPLGNLSSRKCFKFTIDLSENGRHAVTDQLTALCSGRV